MIAIDYFYSSSARQTSMDSAWPQKAPTESQRKLLKGGLYRGLHRVVFFEVIQGDTRSLDYSSDRPQDLWSTLVRESEQLLLRLSLLY